MTLIDSNPRLQDDGVPSASDNSSNNLHDESAVKVEVPSVKMPNDQSEELEDSNESSENTPLHKEVNPENDVIDKVTRAQEGHGANGDLHAAHCSSKSLDNASERLLKNRANSMDVKLEGKDTDSERDEGNTEETTDDKLPIDKGWAWIILLASVYTHFIVIGQLKCFGIVFVQLQHRYGSSSSATTVIYTLMNASYSISALVIMTIGNSLSARTSVFIGATLSSIASMITAFINDVNIAIVTIGIATGVSNAFIMPMVATIISTYFVKKRGFANNVGNCGVSLGAIALAPIVTKLFETYSYTGTYIIFTGLNLQMFLIGCLLRPMSFYTKHTTPKDYVKKTEKTSATKGDACKRFNTASVGNGSDPRHALQVKLLEKHHANGQFNRQMSEIVDGTKSQIRRRRAISESETGNAPDSSANVHSSFHSLFNSTLARYASTDMMNCSLMDITLTDIGIKDSHDQKNIKDIKTDSRKKSAKRTIINSLKKLFDIKLLSKPEFQYFLVCNAFLCAGCSLATAFLPPLAFENGVSNGMVALMVSIMSTVEFCSRFVVGYISDKNWCHRSTLIAIATLILGVAAHFLHFMTTFSTLMIYAVIGGLLQGVYFALFVVVILDILSFDEFKGALGFTSLIQGIASGICMPIVGYLRDYTGSYTYAYSFVGTILIIGSVLTYFIPNVHEWSLSREKMKQKDTIV